MQKSAGKLEFAQLEKGNRSTMVFKITEKVSFYNFASEASYVHILSGQKFIKNAKIVDLASFLKLVAWSKQCYQIGKF